MDISLLETWEKHLSLSPTLHLIQLNYSACYFLSSPVHNYSFQNITHQNKTKSSHCELSAWDWDRRAFWCLQTWLKPMTDDVCVCGERAKVKHRRPKMGLFLDRDSMQEPGRHENFPFAAMVMTWKRWKADDYKDSDYRVEKPSPLWCLVSLLVKEDTMTQTMSRADRLEKSIWKECSELSNCCSTNYSNGPELYSIVNYPFWWLFDTSGSWDFHRPIYGKCT